MTKAPKTVLNQTYDGKKSSKSSTGKKSSEVKLFGALYQDYPVDFSSKYFSAAAVADSVLNIKAAGFTRDSLLWGYYQKFAASDPKDQSNWSDVRLYQNWESAIAEAREALLKMPVDRSLPGPDPDNPGVRARNMLEHLDTAVRIALFDKHLLGSSTKSGVAIEVSVGTQARPSRRHKVMTSWQPDPTNPSDPKYKWNKLIITMTCPKGGWIGPAVWKYNGPSRFTRYTATYKVPAAPVRKVDQILFIFNGLESLPNPQQSHYPGILQPVLQWTKGDGWAIRSWYVPSNYAPSIEMMPGLNEERRFTDADSPAWTKAIKVPVNKKLKGVVEWDGMSYQSSFVVDGNTVAPLLARNILPLTYPVAVVEAYNISSDKKELVDVTMDDITLELENSPGVPIEPTWEIGTDSNPSDGIHYGKGKMQRYKIQAKNNNTQLIFTPK
ncbi:hypothetical protein [Bradyrhizobium sp. AUGA SZCCT0182]|uniref:hypothetical protein n=1 Tax=Bradyrhizobium sp. AUGA SZCCT0182 TaxID=2807667 RepID=UPI001BA87E29|nr:hypothetical protein [Bradyrhizobium sp. AUGA SZCCT0182]MBR1238423.1 hypothetical protein [Bradyrhizobium sp. AUGA SZCCT0182]